MENIECWGTIAMTILSVDHYPVFLHEENMCKHSKDT